MIEAKEKLNPKKLLHGILASYSMETDKIRTRINDDMKLPLEQRMTSDESISLYTPVIQDTINKIHELYTKEDK